MKKIQFNAFCVGLGILMLPLLLLADEPRAISSGRKEKVESLGKKLFFDRSLSQPDGQSCATCHAPRAAFTDPDDSEPTSNGVLKKRFGSRNSPSVAYAAFSPVFHFDEEEGLFVGGQFWDGRAADLVEQAKAPFLNQLEMHNRNINQVVQAVRQAPYANLFRQVFGGASLNRGREAQAYQQIAEAIAAYETTEEVSPFTSKFDYYLKGKARLTRRELVGLELFNNKAQCAACHPSTVIGDEPGPLFTDFTYDNLGIPKNWDNPFLYMPKDLNPDGLNFIDLGLGRIVALSDPVAAEAEMGKFKVSTLRNIAVTAPYGHNGLFKSLKEIVHFYNTRDVSGAGWDRPEIPETMNTDELGNLGLTGDEEDALVAFLETLTDGYVPPKSR